MKTIYHETRNASECRVIRLAKHEYLLVFRLTPQHFHSWKYATMCEAMMDAFSMLERATVINRNLAA